MQLREGLHFVLFIFFASTLKLAAHTRNYLIINPKLTVVNIGKDKEIVINIGKHE